MPYRNPYTVRGPDYEIHLSEPDYSFDLLGIWEEDGGFFIATDSGCSCPSPWESHTKDDLTGPLTLDQLAEEATSLVEDSYMPGYGAEELQEVLDRLRQT